MSDIERPPGTVIVGELVLERWRPSDLEPLFAAIAASIDHLRPWMAWAADHRRDSVAQFLTDSVAGWERGDRFEYAIRDRNAELLGSAGLMARIDPGGLEIGYWIHAQHTRKGIAALAAAALSELGLALSSVDHVEIHHDEANIASGAIPARLGFRELGTFAAEIQAPADVGRDVRWRLDAAQFAASSARSLLEDARGRTNAITLASYEAATDAYAERWQGHATQLAFVEALAAMLPAGARVLEIGSGTGHDADLLEARGASVRRGDATQAFVRRLRARGLDADVLNVITDELGGPWDAIYANAVFLHLSREQLLGVLHKTAAAVAPGGLLAFTLKEGDGEEWTTAKLGHPRHFTYWRAHSLSSMLAATPWTIVRLEQAASPRDAWLQCICSLR